MSPSVRLEAARDILESRVFPGFVLNSRRDLEGLGLVVARMGDPVEDGDSVGEDRLYGCADKCSRLGRLGE